MKPEIKLDVIYSFPNLISEVIFTVDKIAET